MTFLEEVVERKKQELRIRKSRVVLEEMKKTIRDLPPSRDMLQALSKRGEMALVAEIKKASPSAGVIRESFDPEGLARSYERGGASAISVLTEVHFFRGEIFHLGMVKGAVSLPILQKDFIIDPYQVYEGRASGADALLLISSILGKSHLAELVGLTESLRMVPWVEVHDEQDLEKISGLSLPLVGINNRNLRQLSVNLMNTLHLIKKIPGVTIVISESGIENREDVSILKRAGVKGILVGEVLMRAADPAAKITELLGL